MTANPLRLADFDRIVVLTGAGISRESGLHTFRDEDGIWNQVRLEDVATPEAFLRDPDRVHAFYNARRRQVRDPAIQPNPAHDALVRLETAVADRADAFLLVTQNVDNLHERAGSRNLLHMHGELARIRCAACGTATAWTEDLSTSHVCAGCGRAGSLRPDIVWFGEMPQHMDRIGAALADCDLFVSIGTSGTVYPAAGFVAEARAAGATTVELNLEPSDGHSLFVERRYGPATRLVPEFVEALLA
jgi:NAD-dependent deacetylase